MSCPYVDVLPPAIMMICPAMDWGMVNDGAASSILLRAAVVARHCRALTLGCDPHRLRSLGL
jgi:hypothetical protein